MLYQDLIPTDACVQQKGLTPALCAVTALNHDVFPVHRNYVVLVEDHMIYVEAGRHPLLDGTSFYDSILSCPQNFSVYLSKIVASSSKNGQD